MIGRKRIFVAVWLTGLLAFPFGAFAQEEKSGSDRVTELKGKLTTMRDYLKEKRGEAQAGIIKKYVASLDQVAKQFQSNTDLAGMVAVRDEKRRVADQGVLYATHRSEHAALAALQDQVLERLASLDSYTADQLVTLAEKWTVAMQSLQAELVRASDIDAASEAKSAVDQLAFAVWLVEARSLLEDSEPVVKAPDAGTRKTPETGKKPPVILHPLVPVVYEGGGAPLGGRKISTRMDYPSTASRAASARTSGRVTVYQLNRSVAGTPVKWDRLPTSSERQIPRITLRANGGGSYKNCTVVFEYFGRTDSRSGGDVRRLYVESVRIPELGISPVTIDGGGYLYFRHRVYDYDSVETYAFFGSSMRSEASEAMQETWMLRRHKRDIFGFIASVYGEGGELIFQRSSTSKANGLARDKLDPRYHGLEDAGKGPSRDRD